MVQKYILLFILLFILKLTNAQPLLDYAELRIRQNNNPELDYKNGEKWLFFIEASTIVGPGAKLIFDMSDYMGCSEEGTNGIVTCWLYFTAAEGMFPVGFGSFKVPFSSVEESDIIAPVMESAGVQVAGITFANWEISGDSENNTSSIDFIEWSEVDLSIGFGTSFNLLKFEMRIDKINDLLKDALSPGMSPQGFANNLSFMYNSEDLRPIFALPIRRATDSDEWEEIEMKVRYENLVVNEWGKLYVDVTPINSDYYKVQIYDDLWNTGLLNIFPPEWKWLNDPWYTTPKTETRYINAGETYTFEFDVTPEDLYGNFKCWLYVGDGFLRAPIRFATSGSIYALPEGTDVTAPRIIEVIYSASQSSNFSIVFSEPISEYTLTDKTIKIKGETKQYNYTAQFSNNGQTLTINPIENFQPGEQISLEILGFLQDLSNNKLESGRTITYTVEQDDPEPPTSLATTISLSNSSNVIPLSTIKVSGTALYNTGAPVEIGTVSIVSGSNTYTASLNSLGYYERDVAAPSSSGYIIVTVDDGNLNPATNRTYINISSNISSNNYDLSTHIISDFEENGDGTITFWSKDAFKTTDHSVNLLAFFENVDINHDLDLKYRFFYPWGTQYKSDLISNDAIPRETTWGYQYWGYLINGQSMGYWLGLYSARFYVDGDREATHNYSVGWDFTEHRFAKNVIGTNPESAYVQDGTATFYQTDDKVYSWVNFDLVAQPTNVRWTFIEPNGSQYMVIESSMDDPDPSNEGVWWNRYRLWSWLNISGSQVKNKCGLWGVNFEVQHPTGTWNSYSYNYSFKVLESPNILPEISFTTKNQDEGSNILVNIEGSDNTYIQNVKLYYRVSDGDWQEKSWTNVLNSTFQTSNVSLGAFVEGDVLDVYAKITDSSGNSKESTRQTLIIRDTDVTGPDITNLSITEYNGNGDNIISDEEQVCVICDVFDESGIEDVKFYIDGNLVQYANGMCFYDGPFPAGKHLVQVIATDRDLSPAQTEITGEFEVHSLDSLHADFNSNVSSGEAPCSIQYYDNSTGNPTSWQWDFGDGNTSTAQNPLHIYLESGSYDVSLVVSNGVLMDTIVKQDYIAVSYSEKALSVDATAEEDTIYKNNYYTVHAAVLNSNDSVVNNANVEAKIYNVDDELVASFDLEYDAENQYYSASQIMYEPSNYYAIINASLNGFTSAEDSINFMVSYLPPVLLDQEFSISEECKNGDIIDTMLLEFEDETLNYTYSIIEGNENNVISLDSTTGEIRVNNHLLFDYELNSSFTFRFVVQDDGSLALTDTAEITINVLNVNEAECTYQFSQWFYNFDASGGTDSVDIATSDSCDWSITKNCDWVTITLALNGSGNGTVAFYVEENLTSQSRECYISVANDTFNVIQDGASSLECDGYKITAGKYFETGNLVDSIQNEFGSNYTIADWSELEAMPDINAWIACMGFPEDQYFILTRNGSYFNGTTRQYFVQYSTDGVASSFAVHDQIGPLYLGSWYGIKMNILAKKDSAILQADFSSDIIQGTEPLTVQFSDNSTGEPTSWLWDFGDGITSTEQNPVHVYYSAGVYDVWLQVENVNSFDSIVKPAYIIVEDTTTLYPVELSGWLYEDANLEGYRHYPGASAISGNDSLVLQAVGPAMITNRNSILSGDVNGDEVLDIITVQNDTLYVLSGSGLVLSSAYVGISGIPYIYATMLADADGDKQLDIGLGYHRGNNNYGNLFTRIYNGSCTLLKEFVKSVSADGFMYPRGIIEGDIIMTQSTGFGKDPRGFSRWDYETETETWYYDVGPAVGQTSIADSDNDGDYEITGTFWNPHNGATGTSGTATTDGDMWCIVVDEDGIEVFSKKYPYPSDGSNYHKFVDFNGDNTYQILAEENHSSYNPGTSQLHIYNATDGSTLHSFDGFGTSNVGWRTSVCDMTGDGIKEIVTTNYSTTSDMQYILDSELNVLKSAAIKGTVEATGDLNGDGYYEIVLRYQDTIKVLDNNLTLLDYFVCGGNILKAIISNTNSNGVSEIIALADKVYILELAGKIPNDICPQHFHPIWKETGVNDAMNIYVVDARINGKDIGPGDQVGVFDGELCVGFGEVADTVNQQIMLNIVVSGDDGTGNGYITGNEITYKIWSCNNQQEFDVNIVECYSSEGSLVACSSFQPEGTSIVSLEVFNHVNYLTGFIPGWNLFSSPIYPDSADMWFNFQEIVTYNSLIKIQDEGGFSFEDHGIYGGWQNDIGDIMPTEGYKVKVTSYDSLFIEGKTINYPFPIPLKAGWNIMGYPQMQTVEAMEVVQQLIDRGVLEKAQDEKGNSIENLGIYGGWQNFIGNFQPGEGYKIKVSAPDTLWIYEDYPKSLAILPTKVEPQHFKLAFTGNGVDHMNFNLVGINANLLNIGDELAVFDGATCVGAAVVTKECLHDQLLSIAASANDESGMPGFDEGNKYKLQIWKADTNIELEIEAEHIQGPEQFTKHESVILSLEKLLLTHVGDEIGNKINELNCYPNPFSESVTLEFNLVVESKVKVTVMNQLGQKIRELGDDLVLPVGINRLLWDGKNETQDKVTPGMYFIQVKMGNRYINEKVVLK